MAPPLDELGKASEDEVDEDVEEHEEGSYYSHLERLLQNLQEEAKDKSKGWVSRPAPDHTELAYKKVFGFSEQKEDLWILGKGGEKGMKMLLNLTFLTRCVHASGWRR